MEEDKRERASSEPARRPVLYFAGGGLDERDMLYYKLRCPYGVLGVGNRLHVVRSRRDYPVMETIDVDGRRFIARQMDRHVLFRDLDSPPAQDALYLPDTTLEEFAETYRSRPPGRCIMHVPCVMEPGRCVYLFLDTDGTGFALYLDFLDDRWAVRESLEYGRSDTWWAAILFDEMDLHSEIESIRWTIEYKQIDFRWDDLPMAIADLLWAPVEQTNEFCEILFEERINPYLDVPYPHRKDIPLSWQSGSEQELRWLTQAICHTEPDLFDTQEPVTVIYRAATQEKRGGFLYMEREEERFTSPRLMSLCDLAFRLNSCIGVRWSIPDIEGYFRSPCLQKAAERVCVTIEPPSAYEKAEAFLTLMDWLDSNLYDPEKRARFGLPPRVAAEAET